MYSATSCCSSRFVFFVVLPMFVNVVVRSLPCVCSLVHSYPLFPVRAIFTKGFSYISRLGSFMICIVPIPVFGFVCMDDTVAWYSALFPSTFFSNESLAGCLCEFMNQSYTFACLITSGCFWNSSCACLICVGVCAFRIVGVSIMNPARVYVFMFFLMWFFMFFIRFIFFPRFFFTSFY